MDRLYYGAAYYDEYMPEERLQKDIEMLQKANMNVVRIAESTWSTLEPTEGVFDFRSIDRVLQAMHEGGIRVIIGTPTYAVPSWLVQKDPDVLATTIHGRGLYGPRQIMDITNRTYLFHAERVIRRLLSHVAQHPAVIGFQVDNETKYYDTAGANVQEAFREYLKTKFEGDIEKVNRAFGLNYWSNAVHRWEDFPDVRNTINASLSGEFEKFQRSLVQSFLGWQAGLVREYMRPDQFITHNFDFDWRGGSYGVQPAVNHFACAQSLTIAGCDIYHPTQDDLTGLEISLCGALTRSLRKDSYLVLETEAQGFPHWTPYDGQLRLQAFSHLGSGACMVEYWHWHSLHNGCETYWKGVLSHDFSENPVYREACTIGADLKRLSPQLAGLRKEDRIAFLVSNVSLSALRKMQPAGGLVDYNDHVVKWYRALYEMNYECDFVMADAPESDLPDDDSEHEERLLEALKPYSVLFAPALYAASEGTVSALRRFTEEGGTLISGFKSAFSDENTKVYHDAQPHGLTEVFGASYSQYSVAKDMPLDDGAGAPVPDAKISGFFECLIPAGGTVLYRYDHENWGRYAAAVRNDYSRGHALYLGCDLPLFLMKQAFLQMLREAGAAPSLPGAAFPVIGKRAVSAAGNNLIFIYNYSKESRTVPCPGGEYLELLSGAKIHGEEPLVLPPWDVKILAEK